MAITEKPVALVIGAGDLHHRAALALAYRPSHAELSKSVTERYYRKRGLWYLGAPVTDHGVKIGLVTAV